ncbi:MAG: FAD-dependent monooxygenase [Pseudomonadota bacterium]
MTTVLIAGAGPVGLTMANELARYGISVRIVDTAAERTDKSKALVLWSRTLELLDHAGYVAPFLKAGMPAHGAQFSTGEDVIGHASLDSIDSPYAYALMIPQSETERILEEHLATQGVKVERTVTLQSFVDKGQGVEAVLRKADGTTETVTSDWLLGCDGAHSTVRHGLGMPFEGSTQQSDWYLADTHLAGLTPVDRLHIFWHREGILAFFPISQDRWRVIADLGPARSEGRHADPTLEEVQALVSVRGNGRIVLSKPIWLAAFRINERKVAEYGRGRVFLAGDAAHIHSPAGGQGMNTGMQDAFNLSWKLAQVAAGHSKPGLLDSYSVERSAVGDKVLRNAGRLTEAAIIRNPVLQAVRNTVARFALSFPQFGHIMASTLSELDIAYPDSPLSVHGPHHARGVPAGSRWPDRLAADAGKARFTAIGPAAVASELTTAFPALVRPGTPSARTDPHDLYIIRPDGYVGFAGGAADGSAAEAYLRNLSA